MVESCSTIPSLFVFCVFAKVSNWRFAVLRVLPFYLNVVPARESHPGVASLMSSQSHIKFGRSFNFEDVLSLWLNLDKQKEPITQSIRNRRERGSRFKMMFYVIGSEDQSRVLLHTAPANRTKGVVEQFGTSGVPIPCRMNRLIMSQYGRTFLFSCYVCVDIFSTASLYKMRRFPVNAANVNFMRMSGSTFCCCPFLICYQRWNICPLNQINQCKSLLIISMFPCSYRGA